MVYKILDWNTGLSESDKYYPEIFQYIKKFLDEENTIAVLQQIPYKTFGKWGDSPLYLKFKNEFPREKYSICKNDEYNNGMIVMQTVIVTKLKVSLLPKGFNPYPKGMATNREVAIKIENAFSLLGLHADNKNNGKDKSVDYNFEYIQNLNKNKDIENVDIIVGDFNAGDYPEYEHWKYFREILPSHICVCNLPTRKGIYRGKSTRETCIDHVYIKRKMVTKCSQVEVHNNIKFSDHYPITFCISMD